MRNHWKRIFFVLDKLGTLLVPHPATWPLRYRNLNGDGLPRLRLLRIPSSNKGTLNKLWPRNGAAGCWTYCCRIDLISLPFNHLLGQASTTFLSGAQRPQALWQALLVPLRPSTGSSSPPSQASSHGQPQRLSLSSRKYTGPT